MALTTTPSAPAALPVRTPAFAARKTLELAVAILPRAVLLVAGALRRGMLGTLIRVLLPVPVLVVPAAVLPAAILTVIARLKILGLLVIGLVRKIRLRLLGAEIVAAAGATEPAESTAMVSAVIATLDMAFICVSSGPFEFVQVGGLA